MSRADEHGRGRERQRHRHAGVRAGLPRHQLEPRRPHRHRRRGRLLASVRLRGGEQVRHVAGDARGGGAGDVPLVDRAEPDRAADAQPAGEHRAAGAGDHAGAVRKRRPVGPADRRVRRGARARPGGSADEADGPGPARDRRPRRRRDLRRGRPRGVLEREPARRRGPRLVASGPERRRLHRRHGDRRARPRSHRHAAAGRPDARGGLTGHPGRERQVRRDERHRHAGALLLGPLGPVRGGRGRARGPARSGDELRRAGPVHEREDRGGGRQPARARPAVPAAPAVDDRAAGGPGHAHPGGREPRPPGLVAGRPAHRLHEAWRRAAGHLDHRSDRPEPDSADRQRERRGSDLVAGRPADRVRGEPAAARQGSTWWTPPAARRP